MNVEDFTPDKRLVAPPNSPHVPITAWVLFTLSGVMLAICLLVFVGMKNLLASATQLVPTLPSVALPVDTPPKVAHVGPTVIQLKKLQHLVSSQVHVSDIMVGESKWLKGSWIVQGDALLGVDMSSAEVVSKDDQKQMAILSMPLPKVISPRVNYEKTREWDIKGTSWIPLSATVLGDKEAMKNAMMREAQNLVERLAANSEYRETAQKNFEGSIREFYSQVGWDVVIQWH